MSKKVITVGIVIVVYGVGSREKWWKSSLQLLKQVYFRNEI